MRSSRNGNSCIQINRTSSATVSSKTALGEAMCRNGERFDWPSYSLRLLQGSFHFFYSSVAHIGASLSWASSKYRCRLACFLTPPSSSAFRHLQGRIGQFLNITILALALRELEGFIFQRGMTPSSSSKHVMSGEY